MRILSSNVQFAARHELSIRDEEHASQRLTVGGQTQVVNSDRTRVGAALDEVGISEGARMALAAAERLRSADPTTPEVGGAAGVDKLADEDELEAQESPALRLFRLAIEALTGKRIRPTARIDEQAAAKDTEARTSAARGGDNTRVEDEPQAQWALAIDYSREYHEIEQSSVAAAGVVNTADGKQIEFAMQVTMRREYHESASFSVRLGNAKLRDPLVLQFDGAAAELQQGTFAFDLDSDGSLDNIHFMAPGGAALALDRNGNGAIDDGSELFGTRSGDGFAELAAHDADQNGWIDEADPVFDELRLWSRSEDGQNRLSSLAERGVGAIYLGKVSSPFQIKDAENRLQGVVRSTGVWLSEDGKAGVAQQIDLVV